MEKEIICIVCPKGCKISVRTRSESAGADTAGAEEQPGNAGQNAKRPEKQEGPERPEKPERQERPEKQKRQEKPERAEDRYEVSGHSCTRGYEYAISECTNPVRTLTTTVRLLCEEEDGAMPALVPVKSSAPLPKGLLKECMKAVNSAAAKPPVRIGDIIVRDILGTGADIIATANIAREECKWRNGSSSRSTRGRQAQGRSSSTGSAEK